MPLPTVPTIDSVSVSGLAVSVTLGGDAGASYRVRLTNGIGTEEDEQPQTGPGVVVLTALGVGLRYLVAWGIDGVNQTEPTNPYVLDVPDTSDDGIAYYRVSDIVGIPGTPYQRVILERTERPVIA